MSPYKQFSSEQGDALEASLPPTLCYNALLCIAEQPKCKNTFQHISFRRRLQGALLVGTSVLQLLACPWDKVRAGRVTP